MAFIRYHILRFTVESSGQTIHIHHKIPAYLKRCTGFLVKHTKGLKPESNLNEIGWLNLQFNSLKENALAAVVACPAVNEVNDRYDFQTLEITLKPGALVSGIYTDTTPITSFFPYSISVYFRCSSLEKGRYNTDPNSKENRPYADSFYQEDKLC
ncbi:MAG: hypothetical protein CFE21_18735 [Bacteroidetes bacterium B1(2017)]|nr:MAG: hypothetical protein CFE21_18735 [Bacteroidetes bacterium B1(2017)]